MDVWKPKYFEARTLSYLPLEMTLQCNSVVVDYLKKSELEEAYAVTQEAALNGFNVGVDEVVWDNFVEGTLLLSEAFVIRKHYSSEIIGLILVGPCMHCRTMAPCVASLEFFFSLELHEMGKNVYKELVKLAMKIADDQDLGYIGVMASVFTICLDILLDLKELDFGIVACLPFAGNLVDKGNMDSYLLYKPLNGRGPVQTRSFRELQLMADRLCEDLPIPEQDKTARKLIPCLPIRYTFQKAGLQTVWRNALQSDAIMVYNQILEAARSGSGYGLDEQPTFKFFYHFEFKSQYVYILEEAQSGEFVAFGCFGDYWPYRCENPQVLEGSVVINPKYRRKGIGQEMAEILHAMYAEQGYKGMLSDTAIVNLAMNEAQRKTGYLRVGVIPHSLSIDGLGFVDAVYSFKSLEGYQGFSQTIKTLSPSVVSRI